MRLFRSRPPQTIAAWLFAAVLAATAARAGSHSRPSAAHDPIRLPQEHIQSLPPGVKLPNYTPGPIPFHDGERLVYRASWLGIPAAQAELTLHRNRKKPELWIGEATIRTTKLVDVFYRMRDYLSETFGFETFAPRVMYIRQREKHRHDEYTIAFDRARRLVIMSKKNSRGVTIRRFRDDHGWGMLSGAAMALSQRLTVGDTYIFDIFAATNRYVVSFDVAGYDHLVTPLGSFDALRIVPSVLYLSDQKMRSEARATTVWVSADDRKLPLRIDSAVFIGFVRIDLVAIDQPHPPS